MGKFNYERKVIMNKKPTDKDARIKELERKLRESEALQIHKLHYLSENVKKYHNLKGSGIIVTFQRLGAESEDGPVLIRNGLSLATVRSLQRDIRASWEYAVQFEPEVVKDDKTTVQKPD